MSTHDTFVPEPEDPGLLAANLAVGVRLLASAVVFLFMAFVFAFFYLRALNTNHAFALPHGSPPDGWGVPILLCVLLATAVFEFGRRTLRDGTGGPWRLASLVAWVLGLAAVVLQFIEYYNLPFAATDGGLASVFLGFTVVFAVFWLGAVYWMETLWAQSLRQPASSEVASPSRLLRPSANACAVYLYVMVLVELFAFVLLYLVK